MSARYTKSNTLINASEYHEPLRKSRGLKKIRHYDTPIIYNPTAIERSSIRSTAHLWKHGDRLYKLAHQYYGDSSYWWAIAWYNGYPTEAHIYTGATIYIPLNLEKLLDVLGV